MIIDIAMSDRAGGGGDGHTMYAYTVTVPPHIGAALVSLQVWRPVYPSTTSITTTSTTTTHDHQPSQQHQQLNATTPHDDVTYHDARLFRLVTEQDVTLRQWNTGTGNNKQMITVTVLSNMCVQLEPGDRVGARIVQPSSIDSQDHSPPQLVYSITAKHHQPRTGEKCAFDILDSWQGFSLSAFVRREGVLDQNVANTDQCPERMLQAAIEDGSIKISDVLQIQDNPLLEKATLMKRSTPNGLHVTSALLRQSETPSVQAVVEKKKDSTSLDGENGGILALWLGLVAAAVAGIVVTAFITLHRKKRMSQSRIRTRSDISRGTIMLGGVESMLPIVIGKKNMPANYYEDWPETSLLASSPTSRQSTIKL